MVKVIHLLGKSQLGLLLFLNNLEGDTTRLKGRHKLRKGVAEGTAGREDAVVEGAGTAVAQQLQRTDHGKDRRGDIARLGTRHFGDKTAHLSGHRRVTSPAREEADGEGGLVHLLAGGTRVREETRSEQTGKLNNVKHIIKKNQPVCLSVGDAL